jgi:hypothetical protein
LPTNNRYGIRAGAKRTGSRRAAADVTPVAAHQRADHVPQTRPYAVADVLVDLLDVAACALKRGRRLCYLMPGSYEGCTLAALPGHPCLRLVGHSVQGLTKTTCRRLVTMVKVAEYEGARREAYRAHAQRGLTAEEVGPRVHVPEPTPEWQVRLSNRNVSFDSEFELARGLRHTAALCSASGQRRYAFARAGRTVRVAAGVGTL